MCELDGDDDGDGTAILVTSFSSGNSLVTATHTTTGQGCQLSCQAVQDDGGGHKGMMETEESQICINKFKIIQV